MSDKDDELFMILIILAVIIAVIIAIILILYVIIPIISVAAGCGILIGGGNAIYNYSLAFIKNVKPERI